MILLLRGFGGSSAVREFAHHLADRADFRRASAIHGMANESAETCDIPLTTIALCGNPLRIAQWW
jgi:hypothetical protein